jgi:hypothetical protein
MFDYDMDDYARYYDSGDLVNAIAVWDHLSPAIYHHAIEKHSATFDSSLPPIFSAFMPKSGGTFLFNRMVECVGYTPCMWGITKRFSMAEFYPVPGAVECYRRGGVFAHTHAVPSPHWRSIADRYEICPIWVHVRHPAECCLAAFHHFKGEGQGTGETARQRQAAIEAERAELKARLGIDFEDVDGFMRQVIDFFGNWLEEWVNYTESHRDRVYFTFFDELSNTDALLRRVLAQFGHSGEIAQVPERLSTDRRRDSGPRDWRQRLSQPTLAHVEAACRCWDRAQALRPAGRPEA